MHAQISDNQLFINITKPGIYLCSQRKIYVNPKLVKPLCFVGQTIQTDESWNQIYFQFQIKPLQSIRLLQNNKRPIIKLKLGDVQFLFKVIRSQNKFDYSTMSFVNFVAFEIKYKEIYYEIGRKEIKLYQWTNILIVIQKLIQLGQNTKIQLKSCKPTIEIGSNNSIKAIQCSIQNIVLTNNKIQLKKNQNQQPKVFDIQQGPLDTIPETPVPNVADLPAYESPKEKNLKFYLCHDMEGGYKQDTNQLDPYPNWMNSTDHTFMHTYRSLHLRECSTFNYFSHYLITIPPKHWRRLCRVNNTQCLGTITVQRKEPGQKVYLSQKCRKLLVYLCRRYKFDGYLINFQFKICQVSTLLIPWLKSLVQQIHQYVPGSSIVWYDSVISNGMVSYQNEINSLNKMFYQICDGMYLNYWWNQSKLQTTLKFYLQKKPIYVGSDCFGRNTFGGGKYDTYIAVSAMIYVDKGQRILSPALFGMGYTYEMDKNIVESWKINQKSMYRGITHRKIVPTNDKWQYVNKDKQGCSWKLDNQWAITSFQNCKRVLTVDIKNYFKVIQNKLNFIANFITTVSSSRDEFKNKYKITLRLKVQQIIVNQITTGTMIPSQQEKQIQIKMNIDADLIGQKTTLLIIQQGSGVHSQQKVQFAGPRFKMGILYLSTYEIEKDWIRYYRENIGAMKLPYLTNYNMGHGYFFYLQGSPIKKSYDYMSDTQFLYAYVMNPPNNVHIYYSDAYTGGTSLMVEDTKKLKIAEVTINRKCNIFCRVVIKTLLGDSNYKLVYRVSNVNGYAQLLKENKLRNGWIQYLYSVQPNLSGSQENIMVHLQHELFNSYLLGQTAIYTDDFKPEQIKIQSLTASISGSNYGQIFKKYYIYNVFRSNIYQRMRQVRCLNALLVKRKQNKAQKVIKQ